MKIGIDVDLTTLASDEAWWRWLHYMTHGYSDGDPAKVLRMLKREKWGELNYGIYSYFPKMLNHNVHPMDFWRNEGVYDTIGPVEGAEHYIKALMDIPTARIVFVTHNKGNGGRSKYNNLVRLFGKSNFDFIVTKEKHLVKLDCLVDDRMEFMNHCAASGIASFAFETAFKQTEKPHENVLFCRTWHQVYHSIKNWIEIGRPQDATKVTLDW